MRVYTIYRESRPELGEQPGTWFPTAVVSNARDMFRKQMYYLQNGAAVKVTLKQK